ncbi:hypothetical protein [Jannaschia pohangensis]|uniref:hypothetical protein n=1 Tax=Jannaschia pohangensis TaxID=390807 RepID=UPI000B82AA10|nr:hypothetical protein [Jannaschia pohangensis]
MTFRHPHPDAGNLALAQLRDLLATSFATEPLPGLDPVQAATRRSKGRIAQYDRAIDDLGCRQI